MIFWIAILSGVLFVWLAVRLAFCETWVLFFNVIVSIYVSIFLTPLLAELVPPPGGPPGYHVALCMIVLAGGCFAVLQGLSFVFLTGQYRIPCPRVFDVVLAGGIGFVTGFLVLSFAGLVLTVSPLASHKVIGIFSLGEQSEQANLFCITRCCDAIHSFVGPAQDDSATLAAIQKLLDMRITHPAPGSAPLGANEPPATGPPNDVPDSPLRHRSMDAPG
jgi:hypothetical protein